MPKPQNYPVLDRTLYTQRHAVYCALLVGAFVLFLVLYLMWGRLCALRAEADRPAETAVEMSLFSARVPGGWEGYRRLGDTLLMREYAEEGGAVAVIGAERSPAYAFRALDGNPAFVVRKVGRAYAQVFGKAATVNLLGSETVPYLPGVPAIHFFFDIANNRGEGLLFYLGDTEYLFWGFPGEHGVAALSRLMRGSGGLVFLPNVRETFARPVIHSGRITYVESRAVSAEADRELALARSFSARCAVAPEANLVPALEHFREALRLLSFVRQEDSLLGTPEAGCFDRLAEIRAAQVREWFVLLERHLGMSDTEAARKQAQYIVSQATLYGESADRIRAARLLRSLPASKED